jgi:hypothetical protein
MAAPPRRACRRLAAGDERLYGLGVFVSPAGKGSRIWHSGDVDGFSTWLAHYPPTACPSPLMENSQSADMDKDAIEQAVTASIETPCT